MSYYSALATSGSERAPLSDLLLAKNDMKRCRDAISLLVQEEEMLDVIADLCARLRDGEFYKVEEFGKLLLYTEGTIPISTAEEVRLQQSVYLDLWH